MGSSFEKFIFLLRERGRICGVNMEELELIKKRRRRIEDKLRKNLEEQDLKVIENIIDHMINLKSTAEKRSA